MIRDDLPESVDGTQDYGKPKSCFASSEAEMQLRMDHPQQACTKNQCSFCRRSGSFKKKFISFLGIYLNCIETSQYLEQRNHFELGSECKIAIRYAITTCFCQ